MLIFSTSTLPDSTQDILDGIVPSIPQFVTALISLAILLVVCTFLMYKPIKKSIQERKKYVSRNIEKSEDKLRNSEKLNNEAKDNLEKSKNIGEGIIATSVREANEKSNKILIDAKDKSHQIIDEARNQAKSEINSARQSIKNEAIDIAVDISEKLISEKIDKEKDKVLIDKFIEELEKND